MWLHQAMLNMKGGKTEFVISYREVTVDLFLKILKILVLAVLLSSCEYSNDEFNGYYKLRATEKIDHTLLFDFFETVANEYGLNARFEFMRLSDDFERLNITIINDKKTVLAFFKAPKENIYYLMDHNMDAEFHEAALKKLKDSFPGVFQFDEIFSAIQLN